MTIKIGDFDFNPSLIPSLVAGCLLLLFLSLGTWQLSRADEKRAILQDYEQRTQLSSTELSLPLPEPEQWRYRKVKLIGRFVEDRQFLLDNKVYRGQVGVNVLTPFKLSYKEQVVLVDRGWIPMADRSQLPDVDVETKTVNLEGMVYVPYKQGLTLGEMEDGVQFTWPRLIQYLDFDQISKSLDYPVAPLTIRLDPASPYGYRREWQPIPLKPDTHIAYAMQWFTLAGVLVIIYLALSLKKIHNLEPRNEP